jgi:hypothetical protein
LNPAKLLCENDREREKNGRVHFSLSARECSLASSCNIANRAEVKSHLAGATVGAALFGRPFLGNTQFSEQAATEGRPYSSKRGKGAPGDALETRNEATVNVGMDVAQVSAVDACFFKHRTRLNPVILS